MRCPKYDRRESYLFGDPYEIVKTSYRKIIHKEEKHHHFKNFQVDTDYTYQLKILEEDVLGLEKQFDSWYNKKLNYPVMVLNYKYMWDYIDDIIKFVGTNFTLPPKRNRKPVTVTDEQEDRIKQTYRSLKEKIDKAEPTICK